MEAMFARADMITLPPAPFHVQATRCIDSKKSTSSNVELVRRHVAELTTMHVRPSETKRESQWTISGVRQRANQPRPRASYPDVHEEERTALTFQH